VADEQVTGIDELLEGIDRHQAADEDPQAGRVDRDDHLVHDRPLKEGWHQRDASADDQEQDAHSQGLPIWPQQKEEPLQNPHDRLSLPR